MGGLRWCEVREWFDLEGNGALPDVHVPGTTIEDWRVLVALMRSEGWRWAYLVEGEPDELPATVEELFGREDVALNVWPAPGMLAIFHLYDAEQIDFDVDLRELQGQRQLDVLCGFFTTIGRALGKRVLMTPEGYAQEPVIGYDVRAGRVVVL